MSGLFPRPHFTPQLREALAGAREEVLVFTLRGLRWVALGAVLAFSLTAIRDGTWASAGLYFGLFLVVMGLSLADRLSLAVRGGLFVGVIYAVSIISLLTLGLGGSARLFLLAFAVFVTIVFGIRAGLAAAGLSLITWFAAGAAFSLAGVQPAAPPVATAFVDWFSAGVVLLLITVALVLPQRHFLETQAFALATSRQKEDLELAQARLQDQAAALAATSRQLAEANERLQTQAEVLERRASQFAVSAEVARTAANLHNLPVLLHTTVTLISQRFGYSHAGIFLLDDAREWAVLQAASSQGGQRMLEKGHRLRVGRQGIVGYVTGSGRSRVALNVGDDSAHFQNPDLPETESEMAVPLRGRWGVIGALDVQSEKPDAFSNDDLAVLETLADQLAVAIDNARLFEETRRSLDELRAFQSEARQLMLAGGQGAQAYRYDGVTTAPVSVPESPDDDAASLQVPIRFGDDALGQIEIHRTGQDWSNEEHELVRSIADRMALALENARLFEETQLNVQRMASLSAASLELTGPQFGLDELLERVAHRALQLLNADGAGIWLPVSDDEVELRVAVNYGREVEPGRRMRKSEGVAGWVYGTGRGLRLNDYSDWARRDPRALDAPFRAALAVPMLWQDQPLGVLALTHTRPGKLFSEEDETIAQLFAAAAASALENARLLEESQQRITELATINQVGEVISSQLSLDAILAQVGDAIAATFRAPAVSIALYNEAAGQIELPYSLNRGERAHFPAVPLGQGLSSIVLQTKEPLLINHDAEQRLAELGAVLVGAPPQSWLGVPIVAGGAAIGLVVLQSEDEAGLFSDSDASLLTTIAANLGAAIQNARLFNETRQRLAELAALNSISQVTTTQTDLADLLRQVGDKVCQTFGVSSGYIALYDDAQRTIELPYFLESGERLSIAPVPLGRGLSSIVITSRQPLLINQDAERQARELGAELAGSQAAKSWLGVPITAGQRVIGVLNVQDVEREGLFSDSDVRLLTTIAANLGAVIQNARLFDETQRRARQLAAAAEVSRATISLLDEAALIEQAVDLIRARFGLYYVALFLVDAAGEWADLRYGTGEAGQALKERGHRLEIGGKSMIGWAISNRRARIAEDVGEETVRYVNPFLPETRSEMALPLVVGDHVLGALSVQSTAHHAFAESDIAALQTMVDQLAIALQNARHYEFQRRTAERLAEVDRLKSQFLANMSHELRTPLNSIIGFSRVILKGIDGPLTELQQQDLTSIYNAGQHLLGLITDVLDMSKIEAGKMELIFDAVNLRDLVSSVLPTAQALVKDKPIAVQTDLPADLPPAHGDAMRIRQVLINLLSNAAKFTSHGAITLRARLVEPEASLAGAVTPLIEVSVIDTGQGIAPEDRPKLFEPFSQVDASLTRKAGGTGLGLSISRHLVELHGGQIWVESETGRGATFVFTLPAHLAEPIGLAPLQFTPSGGPLIMAVDDDPGLLLLYRRYVEALGFQYVGIARSTEAAARAAELKPAAILLDVMMPAPDGWQVLAQLKRNAITQTIPVIMCTLAVDPHRAQDLGAAEYLVKPILESDVARALKKLAIDGNGHGQPEAARNAQAA